MAFLWISIFVMQSSLDCAKAHLYLLTQLGFPFKSAGRVKKIVISGGGARGGDLLHFSLL